MHLQDLLLLGSNLTWLRTVLGVIAAFFSFQLVRGLYRITLHPLSKFPGPKLTAMTRWYEAYYEVVMGGQFSDQIIKWHAQYGPIVRVNPFEIHIDDPDYYDALFNFDPHLEKRVFAMGSTLSCCRCDGSMCQKADCVTRQPRLHSLVRST